MLSLTGPSGIGKSHLKRELKKTFGFAEPPVYTTRAPRTGEVGERIFVSEEDFHGLSQEFAFINEIYGNRYGIKQSDLQNGGNSIIELYIDNLEKFKELVPDACTIALITNSESFLKGRLERRGEKNPLRLSSWKDELDRISTFDFEIVYDVNEGNEHRVVEDISNYIRENYVRN